MKFKIIGRNIEVTEALKDSIEKKIGRLDKYFNPDLEAKVTLSVEKNRQIVEVTIPTNGVIVRGEETTEDMYTAIDRVVDKIERQIVKHKHKIERRGDFTQSLRFSEIPTETDEDDSKVVKTKKFAVKPMDIEEAVLQMDLLGHNFFVFRSSDTDEVNVVYKRKDGNYGLIEPEF
ncbi:ribosome hibernation-promoting factor, HPF/YfiA family [Clostridium cylindrosporum]|uniref:Ribosome hibernation promoting factor n=1 Tax=Clostridium cylindrosporum DSM 605 TaxID=1121307 RepID=A0A0J8DBD5_CLOCY|nr:ribosome-associated translation inhibitor RaiA [Clostridium cylindrosporum]KMT23380.1 SSU ribosomal protein S30P/sigma 54 modulation protein [Clostridium cylindrosporum DSM 605]